MQTKIREIIILFLFLFPVSIANEIENHYSNYWINYLTSKGLEKRLSYFIVSQSIYNGIDPKLTISIMEIESNYRIGAVNRKSQAKGLFQIIPSTGDYLCKKYLVDYYDKCKDRIIDPYVNSYLAIKYIRELMSRNTFEQFISIYGGYGRNSTENKYITKLINLLQEKENEKKKTFRIF
jgi:hypothetical protein